MIDQQPFARVWSVILGGIVVSQKQRLGAGVEAWSIGSLNRAEWL